MFIPVKGRPRVVISQFFFDNGQSNSSSNKDPKGVPDAILTCYIVVVGTLVLRLCE